MKASVISSRPFLSVLMFAISILLLATSGIPALAKPSHKRPAHHRSHKTEPQHLVINKIKIQGNRRIEADAIRAKLISKEGGPYDPATVRQDIQALFDTGYFYNVTVERSEGGPRVTVTYVVQEKPSIEEIDYEGNDEIEDGDLKDATGLKPYEFVNRTKIQTAIEKLQKLYEDKGFFLARISYALVPTGNQGNVKLVFKIQENAKVKVKRISFIGNRKMSSGKLKSAMVTKEGSFFSFISGSGAYKQDAFDRDIQMLNYLYFNEGFVQVKIDRPQVYVTPDKRSIYISIRIDEGEQFSVGNVDFTGDILFPRDDLFDTIHIDDAKLFKYSTLQEDIKALTAKYGDLGYAYVNPIPRTRVREADKKVDVTFEIDKGPKVYIHRITVIGNTKTRDKVVRRELKVHEGELYNETRRRESEENVKRLGYFENVTFNTKAPPGHNDWMDIEIHVKERNTGTIQAGAGYSSYYGAVINAQVSQINFLGKGQKLSASLDLSKLQSLYKFSFTEPYFMDTEWSTGIDVYQSQRDLIDEYTETKRGGAVRLGHPLAPYLDAYFRYRMDKAHLSLDPDNSDEDLFPVEQANGTTSSVTMTLEYDKRNDRFAPTKGVYSSVSLEYAGIGGSKDFTRGTATFRYYHKVFWDLVWRNNLNYGFISPNNSDPVPFNELFLLGGANSLRGFDWFTVGRRKLSNKLKDSYVGDGMSPTDAENKAMRPYGGTQQLYYNLEFQFPLIAEAGIQGVVFYDVGDADDQIKISNLRQDVGFGFRWYSPIGPLRFEWGFPLHRKEIYDEKPVNFEFAIGSPF